MLLCRWSLSGRFWPQVKLWLRVIPKASTPCRVLHFYRARASHSQFFYSDACAGFAFIDVPGLSVPDDGLYKVSVVLCCAQKIKYIQFYTVPMQKWKWNQGNSDLILIPATLLAVILNRAHSEGRPASFEKTCLLPLTSNGGGPPCGRNTDIMSRVLSKEN